MCVCVVWCELCVMYIVWCDECVCVCVVCCVS